MMDAKTIKQNQARMETERAAFDSLWADIAVLVLPRQNLYFGGGLGTADWNRWKTPEATMHDPYAAQALNDGVAAFEGFVMPRGQRWQTLGVPDESLMAKVPVRQWLEKAEKRLFALRNDPMSGFAGAIHESSVSLFAFGAQSIWPEIRRDRGTGRVLGLSYESEFIGDIWADRDAMGYVGRTHRRIVLTAEQAQQKWGENIPPKVREALTAPNADPQRRFEFIHVIEPNPRVERGRIDAAGMGWRAAYYSCADEAVFLEGGYRSAPRIVSRWAKAPNATWGDSPTMQVLPLIRMVQQITGDRVIGAEMRLKPPLLLMDDELDSGVIDMRPFGRTYGGLDERGNPKVRPFLDAADASDAAQLMAEAYSLIDRAFFRDLLQINRELKTHVSAARTMEEVAEKGLLLSPLARQENEWLSRMTQREITLMDEIGLLDDMPAELEEYFADNGGLDIRYDNTLSHMQEAGKSAAFLNLAQQVGLLAQFDPSVIPEFKHIYPTEKVVAELGRIAGVPASMMATEAERADAEARERMQQQVDQLLQAAPALAAAARDAAAAGAMGNG